MFHPIRQIDEFIILKTDNEEVKNKYMVVNIEGDYDCHSHLKTEKLCLDVISYIKRKKVPNNYYLRESCRRLTLNKKYIKEIDIKNKKEKDKSKYINKPRFCR